LNKIDNQTTKLPPKLVVKRLWWQFWYL